jgi:hypothetical protein
VTILPIPPFARIILLSADIGWLKILVTGTFIAEIIKPENSRQMKKFLFLVFTTLIPVLLQAQGSASLRMNLEKNKVYRFRSVTEQTVSQTINGVQQNTEAEVTYSLSLKMVEAAPEFMVAEVRFDTLITNTNTMGKISKISSAVQADIKSSESSDVMSCIMNRLSMTTLFVKFDYTGKPLEILNSRILPQIILKDTADITLTGPVGQAVKKQVAETVSDGNLKTMIALFTHFLPGRAVTAGEEWTIMQQMSSGGMQLEISTTYKFDGSDGSRATITAESAIKAADNAAPIQSGGATVTYSDLKGISRATMVVDSQTGLRLEETGRTHISGNLGISGPGFSMQMPMDINGESKIQTIL